MIGNQLSAVVQKYAPHVIITQDHADAVRLLLQIGRKCPEAQSLIESGSYLGIQENHCFPDIYQADTVPQ